MSVRRVAVLSDVHGNAVALQAVLEELDGENVDLIVFGGDLTWGPLPAETLALVAGISTQKPSSANRASGDPLAEQMVELLLSPRTRAEVIEDAERREFAG